MVTLSHQALNAMRLIREKTKKERAQEENKVRRVSGGTNLNRGGLDEGGCQVDPPNSYSSEAKARALPHGLGGTPTDGVPHHGPRYPPRQRAPLKSQHFSSGSSDWKRLD